VAFGDDSKPAQHHVSFRNQDSERKKISSSKHTKKNIRFSDRERSVENKVLRWRLLMSLKNCVGDKSG